MSTSKQMVNRESAFAPSPITYEDLPPEHQQKYNELLEIFKVNLIGSYERTRTNDICWKGFNPEGAIDGVDLSTPSEERTRALHQELNYMVAHSLHCQSESLVNAFERVALRVVEEIMKRQYSPTGPTLGSHQAEASFFSKKPQSYSFASTAPTELTNIPRIQSGGGPDECQYLDTPPQVIPHGYACRYIPDRVAAGCAETHVPSGR